MSDNIYEEGQVATVGNMTITDITHKPKRMQGDNIPKNKQVTTIAKEVPESSSPVSVTLESAIKYYEANAVGEFEVLYKMTAKWLETLRKNRVKQFEDMVNSLKPEVEE